MWGSCGSRLMRLIAHAYASQLDDEKCGAWSLACGRLGQANSCARWSLAGAASGRPLDRDSEVIGSTGAASGRPLDRDAEELPAAAAASGRPPADSDSASACVSILDSVGLGVYLSWTRTRQGDATKSKIDTDTASESESLNTIPMSERPKESESALESEIEKCKTSHRIAGF